MGRGARERQAGIGLERQAGVACQRVQIPARCEWYGAAQIQAIQALHPDVEGIGVEVVVAAAVAGQVRGDARIERQIPIEAPDTTGSLTTKLSLIAARLLIEVLVYWPRGELTPRPQNEAEATYSPPITKEQAEIDWQLPAIDLWRRVRAFQPGPGGYTRWRGKRLEIIEAVPLAGDKTLEPGRVVALSPAGDGSKAGFGVATGDGVLGVVKIQAEGRRAVSATDFLRGQPQLIGEILPSPQG